MLKTMLLAAALLSVGVASAQGQAAPATAAPILGQGPGYHDPRSAFKPLEDKPGVLPWSLLSQVTARAEKKKLIPSFPAAVQALDQKTVKIQGFMMPLEPGDKQSHFLLSSVPTSCPYCVPAGPEGLVEVKTKQAVRYTVDPVIVEGTLLVLNDDPYGLYYRVTEGVSVR